MNFDELIALNGKGYFMEDLLRRKEAAGQLGVKPASLITLEKKGLLHPLRDWAGHRRFRQSEIDEFREKLLSGEIGELANG